MKKYFYTSLLLLLAFFFPACSDYLDVTPDNRTEITNLDKIGQLLVRAYNTADYYTFAEAMSDNVRDRGPARTARENNEDSWNWKEYFRLGFNNQGSPTYFWSGAYIAIAHSNQALHSIEQQFSSLPESQPYRGEALVARAYNHFMLVNFFAKHFEVNTASQDMGIPYVEKTERKVLVDYKRGTVKEVYDKIERDLLEGLPLINDKVYSKPKFHFTQAAALAFAVRFYLFKGEWNNVIKYANQLDDAFPLTYRDYSAYLDLSYADRSATYGSSTEGSNLLLTDGVSWYARRRTSGRYGLTDSVLAETVRSNFPTSASTERLVYKVYGRDYSRNVAKFTERFQYRNFNARTGIGHISMPLLVAEEVLLSRAEAYVMLSDSLNALKDLNKFYMMRVRGMTSQDSATTASINSFYNVSTSIRLGNYNDLQPAYGLPNGITLQNMLKAVLDARRAEFMNEGLRWFDIRRMRLVVVHRNIDNTKKVLTRDDLRKVLQIPEEASTQGITPNPR